MINKKHKKCVLCDGDAVMKCSKCNKDICLKHGYCYIDESNIAITQNAPMLCGQCYIKTYRIKKF
ncbi:hypothetical protein [Clostridium rectalis]|uniref:hypothetical protein n=1 Tax=Clostridium rectalis TaxID=2040295 RepID=UPI000F63FB82|nr:hypothetical protein [Clostridium rectalis]